MKELPLYIELRKGVISFTLWDVPDKEYSLFSCLAIDPMNIAASSNPVVQYEFIAIWFHVVGQNPKKM